jgi:peptidyl-prolyl cis-trans isomerase B (cyclophilin B)
MKNLLMKTNFGEIKIELDDEKAPITAANFIDYVKSEHFDASIFHRVIPGFMIQGGGFTAEMKEKKSGTPIQNEAKNGLKNNRGTLAMARTNAPHSATAQFFINLKDNDFLNYSDGNWGYAVFGKVSEGMDIVDNIAKVETGSHGHHDDVPKSPVIIEKVTLV